MDLIGLEWAESAKIIKPDPGFFDPGFLNRAVLKFLESQKLASLLVESSRRIVKNPAAMRLFWHQHYLVARNYDRHFMKCYKFPELPVLGEDARAYFLLLAFSGYHFNVDWHAKKGIPERFLEATVTDFRISVQSSMKSSGFLGLAPHYSGWWQGLFNGKLYRLGRLTFLHENYRTPARVFENKKSGAIKIFSDPDILFNADGLVAFTDEEKATGFRSQLTESNGVVQGTPVRPDGFASPQTESLALSEWREIVTKNDPVIGVHISPGSPMDTKECEKSFAQAIDFCGKYFSDVPFKAFVCDSWLLDPALKEVQPEESNIVQFQKRYHLVPSPVDMEFITLRTIFGTEALKVGFENVPHATALQKRAAEFKRQGKRFRSGLGIHPWRPWDTKTH